MALSKTIRQSDCSRTTEGIGTHLGDVGGGESGWIARAKDSEIIFAGSYGGLTTPMIIAPVNYALLNPIPTPMGAGADVLKYRFQWNFPIIFTTRQHLYLAAEKFYSSRLMRSLGHHRPDLTERQVEASPWWVITKDIQVLNTTTRSSR